MQLRPIRDIVLARRLDAETLSPGGIIIPDNVQKTSQRATVVAVGPGRILADGSRSPMAAQVGDVIVLDRYGGTDVTYDDGEKFVAVLADSILGIEES